MSIGNAISKVMMSELEQRLTLVVSGYRQVGNQWVKSNEITLFKCQCV